MHYIKLLLAYILSWFKASEPGTTQRKPQKKHKKHVHLTDSEKKNLYAMYAGGEEPTELARAFNVSMATVYRIVVDYDRRTLRAYNRAMRQKEAA